ncbi:MAG TPA: hypothetical protein VK249_30915 [Anaerolineales bacterium]|nr:hypothetical protein [Anaerolineales bacterium]
MNRRTYSQILDHVAREHLAENTDLAPRILARIQKGKSATMQPRKKIFVTAFLILLVLVIVLANVPAVRAAIQRWIGYVPGMGLVGEGQIRVLAEPVAITREGITLTVEQMWVDSDRTFIQYSVEGWPWRKLSTGSPTNRCLDPAVLRLSDRELAITRPQSSFGWVSGYQLKSIYPAIPATVNKVAFVMPCLVMALPGEAPEDWELSLRLIPAPPGTVFPVIEISTPVEATPTVLPQAQAGLVTTGISLALDRAVQMDDGYLLYATVHWENTGLDWIDFPSPETLHLLAADGQEVLYELDWEATNALQMTPQSGQTTFAIKTAPIYVSGPLTLVLDSVSASAAADASFSFDPGPDPKPEQVWGLNQDVNVGHGHSLRVLKVTYHLADETKAWLSFELESQTGITYASLFDKAHPLTGTAGGGGGGASLPGPFTSDLYYLGPLPAGPITANITGISFNLPGHWEAQWTPPVSDVQITPEAQDSACLTRESWEQALQQQIPLPDGLNGTLALFDVVPPTNNYQVSVAKLDGSENRSIGPGSVPSLSPDKTHLVSIGPMVAGPADGLYMTDLASGNTSLLPGTTTGDINPLWSPDGSRIAFTRGPSSGLIGAPGPYKMMVTDPDGSNLRQLTDSSEVNYAMAWMPDGKRLLYTMLSRDGASLHIMDIQTGEASSLFDINYNGSVVVSPDGKRLAFEEMLPLDRYGLFVANLDGSHRKLLSSGDPYIVTVPAWSPDGEWVIASLHDPDGNKHPNPILVLIHVDSCQMIALPNLSGYVTSWLP